MEFDYKFLKRVLIFSLVTASFAAKADFIQLECVPGASINGLEIEKLELQYFDDHTVAFMTVNYQNATSLPVPEMTYTSSGDRRSFFPQSHAGEDIRLVLLQDEGKLTANLNLRNSNLISVLDCSPL